MAGTALYALQIQWYCLILILSMVLKKFPEVMQLVSGRAGIWNPDHLVPESGIFFLSCLSNWLKGTWKAIQAE